MWELVLGGVVADPPVPGDPARGKNEFLYYRQGDRRNPPG